MHQSHIENRHITVHGQSSAVSTCAAARPASSPWSPASSPAIGGLLTLCLGVGPLRPARLLGPASSRSATNAAGSGSCLILFADAFSASRGDCRSLFLRACLGEDAGVCLRLRPLPSSACVSKVTSLVLDLVCTPRLLLPLRLLRVVGIVVRCQRPREARPFLSLHVHDGACAMLRQAACSCQADIAITTANLHAMVQRAELVKQETMF